MGIPARDKAWEQVGRGRFALPKMSNHDKPGSLGERRVGHELLLAMNPRSGPSAQAEGYMRERLATDKVHF